ncbi:MAG: imidazolonepropionase [Anaerolineae bacterium]
MTKIDMLITNATVVTCAGPDGPKRGDALRDVGLLKNGAVAVTDGEIVAVGDSAELAGRFTAADTLDAGGRAVTPGLVDCHTHVVYAGDRVAEFEQRIGGTSYMEIMQAGGGIASTMRAVRAASTAQLVAETRPRLDAMLRLGTTTVEIKTGYGLDTASELKMLAAIAQLDAGHPADLIPTFLGAHAIPPEYKTDPDGYIDLVIEEMLPAAAGWYQNSPFSLLPSPFFCDVFCEANVFSREQSARVLRAGQRLGLAPKIHADEFESLGGVALAVELGATSADHLDVTPAAEMARLAQSGTVGVVLPAVNFNLGSTHFANARALADAGVALALSTDINPGSAPCPSLPLVMALACRYQRLLPAEALNAVTLNAAHAVGLGERLGSIEPGKQADLLILSTPDYRHLAYEFGGNLVKTVIKRGRVV